MGLRIVLPGPPASAVATIRVLDIPLREPRTRTRLALPADGRAALAFLAAAVYATWPLARHATTRVPHNLIDSLDNAWIFGWVAHAMAHAPLRVFDANIFAPESTTLAYSENLLGLAVPLAPVFWLTRNAVLSANIAYIAAYAASGYATYALVRDVSSSRTAALVAGMAFGLAPYRVDAIVHPHVVAVYWLPVVLLFALRLARKPGALCAAALGAALAAQFWTSLTGGVFALVALGAWTIWVVALRRRSAARPVAFGAAALMLGLVLSLPVLVPYAAVRTSHPEARHELGEVRTMSATPTSYLLPTAGGRFSYKPYDQLRRRFWGGYGTWEKQVFPGVALTLATIVGVVLCIRRRRTLGATAVLLVGIAAFGFALSLGTRLGPVFDLVSSVSGGALRVPARFATLVIFAMAVLVGVAFATLSPRVRSIAVTITLALLAVELAPTSLATAVAPRLTAADRALAGTRGVILALPTSEYELDGSAIVEGTVLREPIQLLASTAHFHKITNGYGSFAPNSYWSFVQGVQDIPNHVALSKARDRGVRTVVVRTDLTATTGRWRDVVQRLEAWPGIRLIASSRGVRVYDISGAEFIYLP